MNQIVKKEIAIKFYIVQFQSIPRTMVKVFLLSLRLCKFFPKLLRRKIF